MRCANTGSFESPRTHRSWCATLLIASAACLLAFAQAGAQSAATVQATPRAVTETDVLAAVRARDLEVVQARAATVSAAAEEIASAPYPNPQLSWEREHVPGSGTLASHKDELVLSIPIELSGRRGAARALAEAGTSQAWLELATARTRAAARALGDFHAAIARERRVVLVRAQVEALDEAVRVVSRRLEQGASSGYEQARLVLDAELARSALREAEREALAGKQAVAFLIDVPVEQVVLSGSLEPAIELPSPRSDQRAALVHARRGRAAALRAKDSAGSSWVPAIEASIGAQLAGAGDESSAGYVAGVALELPLFDHGQAERAKASAQAVVLDTQLAVLERAYAQAEASARLELAASRAALAELERATEGRVEELETAIASGYREGYRTTLELIDAVRVKTEIAQQRLALELSVKRAEIALRAALGQLEGGAP